MTTPSPPCLLEGGAGEAGVSLLHVEAHGEPGEHAGLCVKESRGCGCVQEQMLDWATQSTRGLSRLSELAAPRQRFSSFTLLIALINFSIQTSELSCCRSDFARRMRAGAMPPCLPSQFPTRPSPGRCL
mmetsp:Transcript_25430/g.39884  ORF Transcript_25430/g.39884 Transcript_25430/m.39884 type:complete len:129 (-) Transcript_25430:1325-1711(-)